MGFVGLGGLRGGEAALALFFALISMRCSELGANRLLAEDTAPEARALLNQTERLGRRPRSPQPKSRVPATGSSELLRTLDFSRREGEPLS